MLEFKEKDKLFFTSDLHFYHKNAIEYCSRPFEKGQQYINNNGTKITFSSGIDAMHTIMIDNWNYNIKHKDDIVFILGDFAFTGNIEKIKELLDQLNGTKYLIFGNHDYQNRFDRDSIKELFKGTYDILDIKIYDDEIEDGYQWINMCHYPIESWSKRSKGSFMLHGHIHSGPYSTSEDKDLRFFPNRYDVGVDNNDFTPLSYQDVKTIITRQNLQNKSR